MGKLHYDLRIDDKAINIDGLDISSDDLDYN